MTTVNWNNIRSHGGSQNLGFEELCSQLFRNQKPRYAVKFERRGNRDAGLECAYVLNDESLCGMQAKYFSRAPTSDEWAQVDKSVQVALDKNRSLRHLTICIPQNFDDPKIVGQTSAMDQWKNYCQKWEDLARRKQMNVSFELWGDTELCDRLAREENRGKLWYFFNREKLSLDWFSRRIDETAENAKPRYTEELNVELPIAGLFEGLGRTKRYTRELIRLWRQLIRRLNDLKQDLLKVPHEAKELLERLSKINEQMRSLLSRADFCGVELLPIVELSKLCDSLNEEAWEVHDALRKLEKAESPNHQKKGQHREDESPYYSLKVNVQEIAYSSQRLMGFANSEKSSLANTPLLLVKGAAGKGKTHLFVDVAKRRSLDGLPTIVILGEIFRKGDPASQIIESLGLNLSREEFFQAVESVAQSSGSRALILIDALNEGEGIDLWPSRLPGFLKMLEQYPWIGCALSVRTTYLDAVIQKSVQQKAIIVDHDGFASKPEVAARAFFDHYGINLPKIPLLNPEYGDPLFLKILCQGLQADGLHDLPEGHEGICAIFQFVIDATNRKLIGPSKIDVPDHRNVVQEYFELLADTLSKCPGESLLFDEAERISKKVYSSNGYADSLLNRLIGEGLISREHILRTQEHSARQCVRFSYQRFGDHEICKRILTCHSESMDNAFSSLGVIGQLCIDYSATYRNRGLLEALSIQVPERFGMELVDLLQLPTEEINRNAAEQVLAECLVESLLWRKKESITDNTFDNLRKRWDSEALHDRYVDILITLTAVPDHPLNARRLHNILTGYSLPGRDEVWTTWLHRNRSEDSAVDRLLTWSMLSSNSENLSNEACLLACNTLAWLTTSTVRTIRDRATKGLVKLLTPNPSLVANLLDRFENINDLYILERLYGAVYGIALRIDDLAILGQLANDVYSRLFHPRPPAAHIMVRDYGRCVIERAISRGYEPAFDLAAVRPPYGSTLLPDPPSREFFESMLSGDHSNWTAEDRALSHVVNRFGDFDFSRYYGGPSIQDNKFTSIPLSDSVPPSWSQLRRRFEASLNDRQMQLLEEVKSAKWDGRNSLAQFRLEVDESQMIAEIDNDHAEISRKTEIYRALESLFVNTLDDEQKSLFDASSSELPFPLEEQLPTYDRELFVRTITQRALDLGWSSDRFADFDARVERVISHWPSNAISLETLGAKYLWMAYFETLARLCDHYYLISGTLLDEAKRYDGSWNLNIRTIDPSLVTDNDAIGEPSHRWPIKIYPIDDVKEKNSEWLLRTDDFEGIEEGLLSKDKKGYEWVVLEAYLSLIQSEDTEEQTRNKPRRHRWFQIRGYLVERDAVENVLAWMNQQDFMGRWMPEGGESYDVFLGEHYESLAWRSYAFDDEWQYEDWQSPERGCPAKVAFVKNSYSQNSNDKANLESARISLPSRIIVKEAGLRWSGRGGSWIAQDGEVVVKSLNEHKGSESVLLFGRDHLDDFLAERKYELLWTVLGEKLVDDGFSKYTRLQINGGGRYSNSSTDFSIRTNYIDG